jgi:hypothetical protein
VTSKSVSVSANQRPRLLVAPRAEETYGDLAADFSAAYGLIPDPWQQLVLDDWLGRSKGQWASLSCGLSCPRQNGKNGIIEIRELFGMVGRGEKILHTAHEVKTARKAFKRLQHFFGRSVNDPAAKFPELNERVVELRNVNGQEAIYLENGGSVEIVARSKNSARGFTADVLIMDEAQELSDEDLEALMPTTSAAPLGDPQWIFTGTPPGPKVNGQVFTRTRVTAREGSPRECWHEWSASEPGEVIDLDDRALWTATNPALGRRLHLEVIEGERAKFSDEGFARERLGVWDHPDTVSAVIPPEDWAACSDPGSAPVGAPSFAVDVTPDRAWCSVAASGFRPDGLRHVEIIDRRPGTSWAAGRLKELRGSYPGCRIVADLSGPAGSVAAEAHELGVEVEAVATRDYAAACNLLLDQAVARGFRHRTEPVLNAALAGAVKADVGDGAWKWSRRNSMTDISPLVAATLALWAAAEPARPVFAY